MPWPHGSTCACEQPPPDGGLLRYTTSCEHHAQLSQALERIAQPTTLRTLTFGQPPGNLVTLPKPCDGSLTCECERCEQERAQRVRIGVREVAQPWEPKRRAA